MSVTPPSATTAFIDLATYTELESYLYGGPNAATWFVKGVCKMNWFSLIPIQLRHQGTFDFGQKNVSASLNRSGDYVLHVWFRCLIPKLRLAAGSVYNDSTIRWTKNLMHNIFDKISITFNELTIQEIDSYWLDYNYQFRLADAKRVGYRNMIGDIAAFTAPVGPGLDLGSGGYLSCPIPISFFEESGFALPVSALPYNDIKINYQFRALADLLVVFPGTAASGGARVATLNDVTVAGSTDKPSIQDAQTWAHYAVVHNDERVKMGDAPRDMLIHQTQIVQAVPFKDMTTSSSFDLRLSHNIVCFGFGAQNVTTKGEQSNYTTEPNYAGLDPILNAHLYYENTVRVSAGNDYYSLIAPFYFSDAIPAETGYHFWSYALHPWENIGSGGTNYSKLANVSARIDPSVAGTNAANTSAPVDQDGNPILWPNSSGVNTAYPQKFNFIFRSKNFNIVRVANGSLGQPVF